MEELGRTHRHYQTTNAQHIRDLNLHTYEIAYAFGVTQNTISKWLLNDRTPVWTKLAAQALSDSLKVKNGTNYHTMVISIAEMHIEALKLFCQNRGIQVYKTVRSTT